MPLALTIKILRSAHTVYLCVLCGSEDKWRLFTYNSMVFMTEKEEVLAEFLNTIEINVTF